jgi:hypothetical protein
MSISFYGDDAKRCTYCCPQGAICTHPRTNAKSGYCYAHERLREKHEMDTARSVTEQLLSGNAGLATVKQLQVTLANLWEMISLNRIPRDKVSPLSYIAVSLLHSHQRAEALAAFAESRDAQSATTIILEADPPDDLQPSEALTFLPVERPTPCPETRQDQQPSHDREVFPEVSFLGPAQHAAEGPVIVKQDRQHSRVQEHDERGRARPEPEDQAQRACELDDQRDPQQHRNHRQMPSLHVSDVAGPAEQLRDSAGRVDIDNQQPPDQRPEPFSQSFHEQLPGGIRTAT